MTAIEQLSEYPPDSDRRLYLLECDSFNEIVPSVRDLPGNHCIVFLIADFKTTTLDDLTALSRELINVGARYFCAAGNGCQTAHLAFDLACCEFEPDSENVILTTDHSHESFTDAIWFVLNCAYPVDPYDRDWHATIAVCANDLQSAQEVRDAFESPVEFSRVDESDTDTAT